MKSEENPKQAARRFASPVLDKGFRPDGLFTYTDEAGKPVYWRIRAKHPATGEKWIRPMRNNGKGWELSEPDFPNGKLLYRLHHLATNPGAPVWYVEGEKCADALAKLGVLATTAGAASSDDKADFSPLAGRAVTIWPDHDTAGAAHGERVVGRLRTLGCHVETISVRELELPDGGDVVDWLDAHPHRTSADLAALPRTRPASLTPRTQKPSSPPALRVEMLCGTDVDLRPVTWLWRDWLAAGALHVLAGAPGTGKSTTALALAATITSGGRWPDSSPAERGDVVIWSGEDAIDTTLAPRLAAMGADMSRIHFVRRSHDEQGPREFDLGTDMPLLREAICRLFEQGRTVRLVVLDPIVSAVLGDSNKAAEVRRSLQPIRDMAEEMGCAILGISHYTKGTAGRDPVERVTGSITFGAVPRLVFGAAKMPDEEGGGRIFVRAKSNLGPDTGGYRYELVVTEVAPGIEAVQVQWGEAVEGSARELLARAESPVDEERTSTSDAEELLRELLASGPRPAIEVKRQAREASISEKALRRARERLRVRSRKAGFADGWQWSLPAHPASEDAQGAPHKDGASSGTFGTQGHLRCPRCAGEGCPHCDPDAAREATEERRAIVAEETSTDPRSPQRRAAE